MNEKPIIKPPKISTSTLQHASLRLPVFEKPSRKHPKCKGYSDYWGEFDCGYSTSLTCDDCKYGAGRKDPEAKCNEA